MAGLEAAATFAIVVQLALVRTICAQNQPYIDPMMISLFVRQGFLNLTSVANGPLVSRTEHGAPLTVEVFMSAAFTPNYDYMIEGCIANGYPFIDQQSCMQCDPIFLRQIESPQYWLDGRDKRTLIHLFAYQPTNTDIINIECSFLVVLCRGCTQRACKRGVTPAIYTPSNYQRFTKSVELQLLNGAFGGLYGSTWCAENYGLPWWIILIIVILAILLIVALILLICCCLRRRRQSVQPTTHKLNLQTDNYRTPPGSLSHQYANPERNVSRSNSAHIATN